MSDANLQSVLRCEHCNKPFDKPSTLKRHGYYCRSRTGKPFPRTRSCITCAKSKARCDHKRPTCSRCAIKNVECSYPTVPTKAPNRLGGGSRPQLDEIRSSEPQKEGVDLLGESLDVEAQRRHRTNVSRISHGDYLDSGPMLADLEDRFEDLNGSGTDILETLVTPTSFQYNQYSYPTDFASWPQESHFPIDPKYSSPQFTPAPSWLPITPASDQRSLIIRSRTQSGPQRTANLILHTLRSYPRMLLRPGSLPPFIHPYFVSSDVDGNYLEPLTNCISLMHMMSSGVKGSAKLFWKNVRMECERICDEIATFDKWELLAAMQALSIYVLVRLDEGEKEYNNYDSVMLRTVAMISKHLVICNAQAPKGNHNSEVSWKDWLYEESRRRLSVVYRVVNMLVYFEPAALCELQQDLIIAPLPTRKQLWEASDEIKWKSESQRDPGAQTDFALAANGELVKLDEGQLYCSNVVAYNYLSSTSGSLVNWEDWCSGMDGFGGLIMLAASLVE